MYGLDLEKLDDGVARDHFQSQSFAFMGCSTDTFSAIRALEINLNRHPGAYGKGIRHIVKSQDHRKKV